MIIPHLLLLLIHSIQTSFIPDNLDRRVRSNSADEIICMSYKCSQTTPIETTVIHFNLQGLTSDSDYDNFCLTLGCIKADREVVTNLNETLDPCEDFYEFACSGFKKWHTIPENYDYVSVMSEIQDEVNLKLRGLLKKKLDGSEPPLIKMAKEFYVSCMDLKTIEDEGVEPLRRIVESLGGWPAVEGSRWKGDNFDWIQFLTSYRESGFHHDIMLYLLVRVDYSRAPFYSLYLDETSSSMHRTHLLRGLSDSVTAAYFRLMVKSAKLLGADEKTAKKELLEALRFELVLANECTPSHRKKNSRRQLYGIKELQREKPLIPWLKFFNALFSVEIHENETFIYSIPELLQGFYGLIQRTNKRVLANYMVWKLISQHFSVLNKEWYNVLREYLIDIHGASSLPRREEMCFSNVTSNFGIALSSYYVRKYFDEESKNATSQIVNYIKNEFLNILQESDWMGEYAKKEAKAKARDMKIYTGYPKELLNDTAVMEVYQNLNISKESYFENVVELRKWKYDFDISQQRNPDTWTKHATVIEVNAFYNIWENTIDVPAIMLQSTIFNIDHPNYLNFGAIGFIIGHEIFHGFDSTGRQLDKDGVEVNWWDTTTNEHYKKRAQCIIDQYNNYEIENGMKVNGVRTLDENVGDNGGLKAAYRAYQSWVKDKGPEKWLARLKYNQNQAFWISAAGAFCKKIEPQALEEEISSPSIDHSPNKFRINGAVSNLAEFAKDFNCPPDSPMNKQPKCQVW